MQVNTLVKFEVTFAENSGRTEFQSGLVGCCTTLFTDNSEWRSVHGSAEPDDYNTISGEIEVSREIPLTEPVAPVREEIAEETVPALRDVLATLPYVDDVSVGPVELIDADIDDESPDA